MAREIIYFKGAARQDLGWKVVSPDDFVRNHPQQMRADALKTLSLVPYCIDFGSKQLIYAAGVDPLLASRANFHYAYLREHAQGFLQVPIERTPARLPAQLPVPALLFSPGRCGSTLLSRMLAAMGVVSLSEPDVYSQAAAYAHATAKNGPDRHALHLLACAGLSLVEPFARQGAASFVFKMRSHANRAPDMIVASFPKKPKTIYLVRGFQGWCESRQRAFSNPLDANFSIYLLSLHALRWLRANTDCLVIRYEDIVADAGGVVERLAAFLQLSPDAAALEAIMSADSQAGTRLARDRLAPLSAQDGEAIRVLWRDKAPRALLKELDLDL